MTTIKITELTDIGANLTSTTVLPVVNMTGSPTTQKTILGNIANAILSEAGGDYVQAGVALLAGTVTTAAQPNITSTGTLTSLAVTGNATAGNVLATTLVRGTTVTALDQLNTANLSANGLANIARINVTNTANLGAVGNITITGGSANYVLKTDGAGNLSWVAQSGGGGNPFDQDLNTTDNVEFANITSTDAIRFVNSGNVVGALGYAPTFVSIEAYQSNSVNITANDIYTWSFDANGVLSKNDANGLVLAANYSAQIITDFGDNDRTWLFDGSSGELVLPGGNVLIDPTDDNFEVRGAQNINFEANAVVNIYTDTSNNGFQWQFGDDGGLTLPILSLGLGVDEQTVVQSQRKIIPPFRYSVAIDGTTPTVVYTATDNSITSMKVTMQIQHTGLGMEFFEVYSTYTGSDTYYTVSNRVQPPTIANSTVVVDLNGSNAMEITVTINSGAANSWVTYDATEFGIAVD